SHNITSWQSSQDGEMRLFLVDDLKVFKITGNGYYKKDKIQAKPDKTENETESVEKPKVNQRQQKVNPNKVKATKTSSQKK
nr:hypothetical protein [Tanacetum cinerariifolium]